jgi:hypothetical protein
MGAAKDRLLSLQQFAAQDARREPQAPAGWQPGVTWDGTAGTITTGPLTETPNEWGDLLAARGLDPDRYEIVGDTIRWCSWDGWARAKEGDQATSALLYSFKADLRLKRHAHPDLEQLFNEVRRIKRPKAIPATGDRALIVCLSDWQVGNADAGGVRTQLEAIAALPHRITHRLKALRKAGVPIGHLVLAGMGDLVEGCHSFYPGQEHSVQLDRREQTRVVRRGILDLMRACAPLAERITLTAVGGNHGEHRVNGKRVTGPNDNDDVAVFEQVAEILLENPAAFGHVEIRLPTDRLAVTLEAGTKVVAFTHGHLAKPKGDPASTLWEWWRGQAFGQEYAAGTAEYLFSGHYHHTNVRSQQGRTLMIAPSLTAVGDWWANGTGMRADPGTLTVVIGPHGWSNLEVLR